MQISFYTQLEEFTKKYDRKLWRKLLKDRKVGEYLTNKSEMMKEDYKRLIEGGYDEAAAMEFLRLSYFDIRGDGEEYLN